MYTPVCPSFILPPTSKKLRRHIGLGLSVRPSIRYACTRSRTVRDRILKFGMCDEYENKGDPYFLLVHGIIALFRVFHFHYIVSLWKLVNKISQEPLKPV